jgi:hypothetical protein
MSKFLAEEAWGMDYWGIAFDTLQVASILSAAGFAALGLFTEYKDSAGKITRSWPPL